MAPVWTRPEADEATLWVFAGETSCASLGSADEISCGTIDPEDSATIMADIAMTKDREEKLRYATHLKANGLDNKHC